MADDSVPRKFVTRSGLTIDACYTPGHLGEVDYDSDLGMPGYPPYTRGIDPELYRDHLWIMGQYSGYGSAKATNLRLRQLLEAGQSGFSIALDLPSQMGLDSDHPLAEGEVGRVGLPMNSLADMEALLDEIPLQKVRQIRTTANAIGPILVAMFCAVAERRNLDPASFRVMLQNDSLKEYVARGTYVFPPRHGLRFSGDVIEYCARHLPTWEPIEFCGYHIRDSGCDAVHEVAIAIANGLAYVEEVRRRGLRLDEFGRQFVLFLSADLEIFEEVAKFRAARRLWSRLMDERYGDEGAAARRIGIFCYTLGGSLTAQEPHNNIIRVAYQALAAALGGVQTLATSSFDEALSLPSTFAVNLSLRTQQILGHETGVASTVDPLGGSYYVETLTNELEKAIHGEIDRIEEQGGAVAALESGYLHRKIGDAAFEQQQDIESGARKIVGVNMLKRDGDDPIDAQSRRASGEAETIDELRRFKAGRDGLAVKSALDAVGLAAAEDRNTIPAILDAVRVYATTGEICDVLAEQWGRQRGFAPEL